MPHRDHLYPLLAVFCTISAASSVFLTQARAAHVSQNDQSIYAEGIGTSTETFIRATSSEGTINLPILVYHIVRPSYPDDSEAVRAIALTPETFDAEMQYLAEAGYHIVLFSDLEDNLRNNKPLPTKPIIISFDDGWGDQFTYAFPILKKYKYPATFFIFTNSIDHKSFMSLNELRELIAAGMVIGSHSRSHPYLTKIPDSADLWDEIYTSKITLEKRLGITINEFAYPFGQYTAAIAMLVEKAGYRSARGDYYTGEQRVSRLYELSALNAPTTLALFKKSFPAR